MSRSEAGGGVQVGGGRETEYNCDGVEAGGQEAAGGVGGWGQWIAICSAILRLRYALFFSYFFSFFSLELGAVDCDMLCDIAIAICSFFPLRFLLCFFFPFPHSGWGQWIAICSTVGHVPQQCVVGGGI